MSGATTPEVRILTVRQPWAWAIVQGGKDIENRSRNIAGEYRGLVAIHAGLRPVRSGETAWWAANNAGMDTSIDGDDLHLGRIIGIVELTDVHQAGHRYEQIAPGVSQCTSDVCCGAWAMWQHQHLVLTNARPLTAPIPYTGALGLRRLPDDVAAQVLSGAAS